jgi:hypothetical protein
VYGPVTTGFGFVNFTGSAIFDQTCSGTIVTPAMTPAKGTLAFLKVKVTVSPDPETPEICAHTPLLSRAGYFLSRLNVKTTSAAVKGLPSLHLTPCRIV